MCYLVPPSVSLQQDQGNLSFPLPTSSLSVPKCGQAHVSGGVGGTLCRSTSITLYWGNTSMGQSSYRTQGMLWPSLFPLLLHSGGFSYSENPREIGKYQSPLSLFLTAYPLPFSSLLHFFMLSLLSFYYFPLARVTVSIFLLRYSLIPRDKEAQIDEAPFPDLC